MKCGLRGDPACSVTADEIGPAASPRSPMRNGLGRPVHRRGAPHTDRPARRGMAALFVAGLGRTARPSSTAVASPERQAQGIRLPMLTLSRSRVLPFHLRRSAAERSLRSSRARAATRPLLTLPRSPPAAPPGVPCRARQTCIASSMASRWCSRPTWPRALQAILTPAMAWEREPATADRRKTAVIATLPLVIRPDALRTIGQR